jgi:hypothetical protein
LRPAAPGSAARTRSEVAALHSATGTPSSAARSHASAVSPPDMPTMLMRLPVAARPHAAKHSTVAISSS